MDTDKDGYEILTEQILGAAFEVMNTLGPGFVEKVYERALVIELQLRGLKAVQQASLSVFYKAQRVGDYFADLLVEDEIVVELKVVDALAKEHVGRVSTTLRPRIGRSAFSSIFKIRDWITSAFSTPLRKPC
jgi:GxxExxY protein